MRRDFMLSLIIGQSCHSRWPIPTAHDAKGFHVTRMEGPGIETNRAGYDTSRMITITRFGTHNDDRPLITASDITHAPGVETFRMACPRRRGHGGAAATWPPEHGRRPDPLPGHSMPTKTWACHPTHDPRGKDRCSKLRRPIINNAERPRPTGTGGADRPWLPDVLAEKRAGPRSRPPSRVDRRSISQSWSDLNVSLLSGVAMAYQPQVVDRALDEPDRAVHEQHVHAAGWFELALGRDRGRGRRDSESDTRRQ